MHSIIATNPNTALAAGLWHLQREGSRSDSRNGEVLVARGPVVTTTLNPTQRVLFSALRDANPFFHLIEALWMLAGRNDVAIPANYAQQLQLYSDDGVTLNGAYGYRWREHFGVDQLLQAINTLKKDPNTRRCVVAMWDGASDAKTALLGGADVPCNTHIYFSPQPSGALDMTVCCRSNDAVWGAHGANAVHFSVLLEFVAAFSGFRVGKMYQFSNNYHIYTQRADVTRLLDGAYAADDRYAQGFMTMQPLVGGHDRIDDWHDDLDTLMDYIENVAAGRVETPEPRLNAAFLRETALPMVRAHWLYKAGNHTMALQAAQTIYSEDWRIACCEWLPRRKGWTGGLPE